MIQTNYTLNDTDYYDTENSSFVLYREKLILTDDVIVNDLQPSQIDTNKL